MKISLKIFFIGFLLLTACKSRKIDAQRQEAEDKVEVVLNDKGPSTFAMGSIENINKQDLLFHFEDIAIKDKNLMVEVQYGGGCIKPHVFELITDGIVDNEGTMNFYLLHKTHNDMCKALLLEALTFDLSQLYNLESNVLTNIRVNNLPKIDLK